MKFQIILKINFNGGQFYKNNFNFGYFKKLSKLHWNKVWNRKCWAFALKSNKVENYEWF